MVIGHFLCVQNVVHVKDCSVTLENASDLSAPSKMFTFDSAYDKDSNTESIYNDICYSLVEVSPRFDL